MSPPDPSTTSVVFTYHTGVTRSRFTAATLLGGWDQHGRASQRWTPWPMTRSRSEDSCDAFTVEVALDRTGVGSRLAWGVELETVDGERLWGITAEVPDLDSRAQERSFTLRAPGATPQTEAYHLSRQRWSGARRHRPAGGGPDAVRYTVWAPNAAAVAVVFGGESGYVADDGWGIDASLGTLELTRGPDGVWSAVVGPFDAHVGRRYMYRVTRADGPPAAAVTYCTDPYSLEQCGRGAFDPHGARYDGPVDELDGTPSCSVVVDPGRVGTDGSRSQSEAAFWADEHDPGRPVPRRVENLVIYELHVGGLAPATQEAGTFNDALALLPYLEALGVNAVELMPMFEFNATRSWGYGSSHLLAIESSAGGRDALKRFVKACHQRGIAVLMDVVYNHFSDDSARATWKWDSAVEAKNIYHWYEGHQDHYVHPDGTPFPHGGYVDNGSSGYAPRYWEEQVRSMFASSAAMLVDEFHLDGLRVDLTAALHADNRLHVDGSAVPAANIFGRKLLRELCQTVKAIDPSAMLIAEDHSSFGEILQPASAGGVGFDARWDAAFYHHLVGEQGGCGRARLLHTAAREHTGPLAMGRFAGALAATGDRKVVYVESHDEAGANATRRTIVVAVDAAPLVGDTRRVAEARCRFAAGMTLLSAGTPMFLMGEEVGSQKRYTYDKFFEDKEDLEALRAGDGARLFRFYQDLIALRLAGAGLRSRRIDVVHVDDGDRVVAFRRWDDTGEHLVAGSLAERPYDAPDYALAHPALAGWGWRERFNSDASGYGGSDVGNGGQTLGAGADGRLGIVIPAMGFVVLERVPAGG